MNLYVVFHTPIGNTRLTVEANSVQELQQEIDKGLPNVPYSIYSSPVESYGSLLAQGNGGNDL